MNNSKEYLDYKNHLDHLRGAVAALASLHVPAKRAGETAEEQSNRRMRAAAHRHAMKALDELAGHVALICL